MASNKDFLPGTRFGDLKVIGKVRTPPGSSGGQRYRMECSCGKRITIPRFYLARKQGPKSHCGCKDFRQDPRLIYTRSSWYAMHLRCYNPNAMGYEHYGGRGITVCERWHRDNPDGLSNFIADMGFRPKNLSIDRIDNNIGYQPGNCRWATAQEQTLNQRHRK